MEYKTYKTTLGHKYVMRVCEDEIHEKRLFMLALVASPLLAVIAFSIAAGLI